MRRERARLLLRGLGNLVAVIVVAAGAGSLLGIGLAQLSDSDDSSAPLDKAQIAGSSTTTSAARSATTNSTSNRASDDPRDQIRVRILDAVLLPATTPSGRQRQRTRLSVRIRAENRSSERVTLARPVLLVAGVSVATDRSADSPETHIEGLEANETAAVTLRFELAGEASARLTSDRRARILIAGHSLRLAKIGQSGEVARRGR